MRSWLRERLVCPRDHDPLVFEKARIRCSRGHDYRIVDDIPILLLKDEPSTQPSITQLAEEAPATGAPQAVWAGDGVHPFVQESIAATNGILYRPLIGKLTRYPIPILRLPEASGATFLDIGCNWGRWSVAAARKGYRPVGIDHSLPAIRAARDVCRQLHLEAEFLVADSRWLPFRAESFDAVFSYSVLQHFERTDCVRALSEIGRVLKAGGTSLVQMANRYGLRSLFHQARRGFRPAKEFEVRYWSPRQLREAFTPAVGPCALSVDGFFGLGIQRNDIDLLPLHYKAVVAASELLRAASRRVSPLARFADSLYVESKKGGEPERAQALLA